MIAKLGGVITQASGTIGGLTISNKGGVPVCSVKSHRTNQNTVAQQETQALYLAALAAYTSLPGLTQLAWKMYVIKHPFNNKLGISRRYTAQQFYISQAIPRIASGLGAPGSPPTKPQQGIGYPGTIAFTTGGPYTFNFTSPGGDTSGYYLVSGARTMSTSHIGRLCPRQLTAIHSVYSCNVDVHADWIAKLGEAQQHEIVVLSIRYAGSNSIISAPVRWTLTVN
jgi:hypothetical protein